MTTLAPILQSYFTDRLIGQRQASAHTIAGYRDTFRLLLGFATTRTGKAPSDLDLADIDADLVSAFLDHLERVRGNSVRTRNTRLAAIHSLFAYTALRHPEHAATIQRVLAIPAKRFHPTAITYLTTAETDAVLAACDRASWTGRRDHAALLLTVQTGLRISELIALTVADLHLGHGAHVHCYGKGRKHRDTPLSSEAVAVLRVWLAERRGAPTDPLFATRTGRPLSRDAIEHRITLYTNRARESCPSLRDKHVTAHTLRHTAAMGLLLNGVDPTVIALWLGHERTSTTEIYLHSDMRIKQRALAATAPPHTPPGRYQPPDPLLAFLDSL